MTGARKVIEKNKSVKRRNGYSSRPVDLGENVGCASRLQQPHHDYRRYGQRRSPARSPSPPGPGFSASGELSCSSFERDRRAHGSNMEDLDQIVSNKCRKLEDDITGLESVLRVMKNDGGSLKSAHPQRNKHMPSGHQRQPQLAIQNSKSRHQGFRSKMILPDASQRNIQSGRIKKNKPVAVRNSIVYTPLRHQDRSKRSKSVHNTSADYRQRSSSSHRSAYRKLTDSKTRLLGMLLNNQRLRSETCYKQTKPKVLRKPRPVRKRVPQKGAQAGRMKRGRPPVAGRKKRSTRRRMKRSVHRMRRPSHHYLRRPQSRSRSSRRSYHYRPSRQPSRSCLSDKSKFSKRTCVIM